MDQAILNWLLGGISSLLGFLLHSLWQAVKDLQTTDKTLSDKVNSIEILVAGQYVTHTDLKDLTNAIFKKLDKIEVKPEDENLCARWLAFSYGFDITVTEAYRLLRS